MIRATFCGYVIGLESLERYFQYWCFDIFAGKKNWQSFMFGLWNFASRQLTKSGVALKYFSMRSKFSPREKTALHFIITFVAVDPRDNNESATSFTDWYLWEIWQRVPAYWWAIQQHAYACLFVCVCQCVSNDILLLNSEYVSWIWHTQAHPVTHTTSHTHTEIQLHYTRYSNWHSVVSFLTKDGSKLSTITKHMLGKA